MYLYTIINKQNLFKMAKQSLKAINATEKKVMVTYEFGTPVFIGVDGLATDKKEEAEIWSALDTSKLGYWKAVTGYKGLTFENL